MESNFVVCVKIGCAFAAAVLLTAVTSICSAYAAESMSFVANDAELNLALESAEQGAIGSIAIAERFYQGSAKRTKDRIRGLIARTFELGNRAVYVYGQPLDVKLAGELLDTNAFCPFSYVYGKFVATGGGANSVPVACGKTTGKSLSEEDMRKAIKNIDQDYGKVAN